MWRHWLQHFSQLMSHNLHIPAMFRHFTSPRITFRQTFVTLQVQLRQPTLSSTILLKSVNTKVLDMPDHEFIIIIVVTNDCTNILSVSVWISVGRRFSVRSVWRGVWKDQGIWNSFTTVSNFTDPILRTDRPLLVVIVGCRALWIQWYWLFNVSVCGYIQGARDGAVGRVTAQKGSIPDGVIWVLHWLKPSGPSMSLGSTHWVQEVVHREKGDRSVGLRTLPLLCGNFRETYCLKFLETSGQRGTALSFRLVLKLKKMCIKTIAKS